MMRFNLAAAAALLLAGCGNAPDEEQKYVFAAAKQHIYPDGYGLVRQFNQAVLDAGHQARFDEKLVAPYFDKVPAGSLRHISETELSSGFVSKFLDDHPAVGTTLVPLLDGKVATITGVSGSYYTLKVSDIEQPCELDYSQAPYRCPELEQPVYVLYKRVKGPEVLK